MKKILVLMFAFVLMFSLQGCEKQQANNDLVLADNQVKNLVQDWMVYTNPAYRYEFRLPKTWQYQDSGEDGKLVNLYNSTRVTEGQTPDISIKCISNWQENYSLDEIYNQAENNYFQLAIEQENIKLDGRDATWLKGVRVDGVDKSFDVIVLDLDDRVMEITIMDLTETTRAIISSLYFYSDNVYRP